MRTHGTLIKWNDDRGFGFVSLPQSHEEIFVHISAFPRDGVRPRIGETVYFEVRVAPDGRKRAEAVERPSARRAAESHRGPARVRQRRAIGPLLTGATVLALGYVGYSAYSSRQDSLAPPSISPVAKTTGQTFRCDGRTHCSQMTSCAEAEYFLKHCPGVQMDGNGDGEPCEQQWCTGASD
jgi:cold shock CspA family protein